MDNSDKNDGFWRVFTAPSYAAECLAIIEALQSVFSLSPNKFLIATDFNLYLSSYIFKPQPPSPIIKIRLLLFTLSNSGFNIQFLWTPGHTRIAGNKFADNLAKSTASFGCPSNSGILWTDFSLNLRICLNKLWKNHWNTLSSNFTTWYKSISPKIPPHPQFHNINLLDNLYPPSLVFDLNTHYFLPTHSNFIEWFSPLYTPQYSTYTPHITYEPLGFLKEQC